MDNTKEAPFNERRMERRKGTNAVALVKVGQAYNGRGYVRDVSARGIRMDVRNIFAFIRPHKAPLMRGLPAKVTIPSESITLNGNVIWIDLHTHEAAFMINDTSNDTLWRAFCCE